jgi:hypothetical protein
MRKIRLVESEMDVKMASAIKSFNSLSEVEKIKWKEAVKQCVDELGYGNIIKVDTTAFLYLAALAAGGIILSIGALVAMAVVPAVFIGLIDKDKILKIIKCARNKRKGVTNTTDTSTPEQTIQETKMKKTIRLTESELVKLVQRIIKEDEMGMSSAETTGKKNCKVSLRNLLSNEKPYNFDYYKNGGYIFTVMEGKGLEQSPGGLAPIRQFNNMDKVFFINEGNQVTIDIRENKGSRGDSFSISCSNGVANLSGKPSTYGP